MTFLNTELSPLGYIRAGFAFVKTFLGPLDRVDSICSRGHTLLKDWTHCPDCRLMNRLDEIRRRERQKLTQPARVGLYCLAGANKGQTFLLSGERTTIGCNSESDIVLTPESLNTRSNYQILANGSVKLTSSDANFFKLNGQSQQSATLLDFDELEFLDNRFIVLDLRGSEGKPT